jgi:hypothetical protein
MAWSTSHGVDNRFPGGQGHRAGPRDGCVRRRPGPARRAGSAAAARRDSARSRTAARSRPAPRPVLSTGSGASSRRAMTRQAMPRLRELPRAAATAALAEPKHSRPSGPSPRTSPQSAPGSSSASLRARLSSCAGDPRRRRWACRARCAQAVGGKAQVRIAGHGAAKRRSPYRDSAGSRRRLGAGKACRHRLYAPRRRGYDRRGLAEELVREHDRRHLQRCASCTPSRW